MVTLAECFQKDWTLVSKFLQKWGRVNELILCSTFRYTVALSGKPAINENINLFHTQGIKKKKKRVDLQVTARVLRELNFKYFSLYVADFSIRALRKNLLCVPDRQRDL